MCECACVCCCCFSRVAHSLTHSLTPSLTHFLHLYHCHSVVVFLQAKLIQRVDQQHRHPRPPPPPPPRHLPTVVRRKGETNPQQQLQVVH